MTDQPTLPLLAPVPGQIRRIVVALDASAYSQAVLRTAIRIAPLLQAQVEGVFVEDDRLRRAASLPITQQVLLGSGQISRFDPVDLSQSYRAICRQLERQAQQMIARSNIIWQFRVEQGEVAERLMALAGEGDLLSLGRLGQPLFGQAQGLGSVARRILQEHPHPVLLLSEEMGPQQPIWALYDDSPQGVERVRLGLGLARLFQSQLTFLLRPEDQADLQRTLAHLGWNGSPAYRTAWLDPVQLYRAAQAQLGRQATLLLPRTREGLPIAQLKDLGIRLLLI
jgi:nucleotide-binding universal stress UspA family protein